ncbi:MAG: hypoxanthine phosphoribosyltransferase [Ruminococcaceae bacterium]|nr:hypoxanthine phosphoribosyltransferase [Oscillospiraceae bacterium]
MIDPNSIGEILYSPEDISKRVKELGKQISEEYAGKEIILVCILKGSYVFTADLSREIDVPCSVEFMQVSSYADSTVSSGSLKIIKDINVPVDDKHLIIIEDIIDTGITLNNLKKMLSTRNPASLKLCAFLDKPSRRKVDIEADYVGYEVEDNFLVGYGLDYAQKYRNLPFVAILKEEIYK